MKLKSFIAVGLVVVGGITLSLLRKDRDGSAKLHSSPSSQSLTPDTQFENRRPQLADTTHPTDPTVRATIKSPEESYPKKTENEQASTSAPATNRTRQENTPAKVVPKDETRARAALAMHRAGLADITYTPSRGISRDYATFFAQANLQPEEAKQVIAIIAEERASAHDIEELSKRNGLSSDEKIKLFAGLLEQTRQNLAAFLPESKLAAYNEYRASLPYRNLIETASTICPKGETIAAETQEAVIATLRKTQAFTPWVGTVRDKQNLSQGDNLACSVIANLLTPTQLEAFRTTLDQRRNEAAKQKLSTQEKQ